MASRWIPRQVGVLPVLIQIGDLRLNSPGKISPAPMRSRLARTKPVTVTTFSDDRRNRQKNGSFKKFEEILEISRSCPDLLNELRVAARPSVARNR